MPIKYYLVKLDYIVLLWPKERMKNIIVGYSFIIESMSPCTYTMSCTETTKPKLFDLLLIEAYSKGERRPTL